MNVGTVVLYLKGIKLAVFHQDNLDLVNDLEDENESQNAKLNFITLVLFTTSVVLYGLSIHLL